MATKTLIASFDSRKRMASAQKPDATAIATFLQFVLGRDKERAKECLSALSSKLDALSESAAREFKTELKPGLQELLARNAGTPLFLSAQLLAARLGLVQIDPASIRTQFIASDQPEATRLQALDALIAFRDP